ncbi:MAG: radical SAM protein [Actinomycetes bacterium]
MTDRRLVTAADRPTCFAPSVQMFLQPDGAVRACSRILTTLGNVRDQSLLDIWHGSVRADLVARHAAHSWSGGCENCGQEVAIEGFEGSFSQFFDERATHVTDDPASVAWPRWIDFNISNACNLQCIQCNGDLSSAIRIHRERRPALVNPYGEQFFDDLRAFIPHLDGALFAGGEPFLANENYRVWDLLTEMRPDLPCTVTTNATQWNDRVRDVLGRLRFSFVVSIDSVTPGVYESIRPGAELDVVLDNLRRYRDYAASVGTSVRINHCWMQQNVADLPEFLLWAEGESLDVNISVVRSPADCSLLFMEPAALRAAFDALQRRDAEMNKRLHRNRSLWQRELRRLSVWVHQSTEAPRGIGQLDRTVMMFRETGNGPIRADDVVAEIRELVGLDTPLVELDVTLDDIIVNISDNVPELLGSDGSRFLGHHYGVVESVTVDCFGPRRRWEVVEQSPDRFVGLGIYGDTNLRITMFPVRNEAGRATGGKIVTAIVRPTGE